MRVVTRVILAAATVAFAAFSSPEAFAWGRHHHGYGHHYLYGLHVGFGNHYGYGPYYGHRRYYHRFSPHYGYGLSYYGGRGYAPPPISSQPAQPAPSTAPADQSPNCREHTRTIVIDGEEQTAYGTVCQQSDGS